MSLLVWFEISSVRNLFGFSETLSGLFGERKLIEHRRPVVQNVRQELFSTTVASNMLFGWRLEGRKEKKLKTTCLEHVVFILGGTLFDKQHFLNYSEPIPIIRNT